MSNSSLPDLERFEQLLVDRATVGLTSQQRQELQRLAQQLEIEIDDSVDLAAATIDTVVATEENVRLPEHLKQAIIASAHQVVDSPASVNNLTDNPQSQLRNYTSSRADQPNFRRRDLLSVLAIGASLLLAAFLWFSPPGNDLIAISVTELRDELLGSKPADLLQVAWTQTDEEANEIAGDVIWSDSLQRGYMTFRGLPRNDPSIEQYQLWIFDKNRNAAHPVDGGVFDIGDDQETIISIDPKIKVDQASMFAITVERPGGVVVSDRSRLPLLGKVAQ